MRKWLALVCCVQAIAQQPGAPAPASLPEPEPLVFSVTTSMVQVDAVVTDGKGHYITDLTTADFEIEEDGKPQKITSFSYVDTGGAARPQPAQKNSERPASIAPAVPLVRENVVRTIVLMVDDLGLSFESMAFVRHSLRKFVEQQMQPGDLVAVCRTASGSAALEQFTNDKRILLAAIDALHWDPSGRVSVFEPYGKYSQLAGGITGGGLTSQGQMSSPSDATSLDPVYDAERNGMLTVGTLGAVSYIVTALRDLPGRKSVVLFSDGINLNVAGVDDTRDNLRDAQISAANEADMALRKLVDQANRAGTVIYTMHATGLVNPNLPDAQDRVLLGGISREIPQQMLNRLTSAGAGRDALFNAGQQGLAQIALATGGFAYENGNDLNWGLARVLDDQRGYYLIGYHPAAAIFEDRKGWRKYHRIHVTVKRAGLHVRSRTGFFGETDQETQPHYDTPADQLHAAMVSPFQPSGVRLRLTALYAEVPKLGAVVRNLLHISTEDLFFKTMLDNSAVAHAEIVAIAAGADGRPVASLAKVYDFRAPAQRLEQSMKQGALYIIDVPVPKRGAYQIHVAVRDSVTGKLGSASQFLEIPDPKKDRVALTSVVLQDGARPSGTPAYAGMAPATRQFHAGGQVEYVCMVEKGKKGTGDLEARVRVMRDGQDIFTGPATLVAMPGGRFAITGELSLDRKMTPGDYYLGVMATVPGTRKNAKSVQWTDFQIMLAGP